MKKSLIAVLGLSLCLSLTSCGSKNNSKDSVVDDPNSGITNNGGNNSGDNNEDITNIEDTAEITGVSSDFKELLSDKGYAGLNNSLPNFNQYVNTDAYRKVTNYKELLDALKDAKCNYTTTRTNDACQGFKVISTNASNWDKRIENGLYVKIGTEYVKLTSSDSFEAGKTYYETEAWSDVKISQAPAQDYNESNFMGSVRVIEIANDIDLGYNYIPQEYKPATISSSNSLVENYDRKSTGNYSLYTMSSMFNECGGISKIKVENVSNLLIYSKNGAKLTHAGFSFLSCNNIVVRNIEMDELWQWEDTSLRTTPAVGNYDSFGWAYMKISHCGNMWIDHCTFGKSFDGQIDVSNPCYTTKGTAFRAPYGGDGTSAVHISWCDFKGGSDDPNGYVYKMMSEIEASYTDGENKYLYYKALRDAGVTFEDILYGIAIPQKKGFLLGDAADEFKYNKMLRVSFGNCRFTNLEDRVLKVRGGVGYFYNCVLDCLQYSEYRQKLSDLGVKSIIEAAGPSGSSKWKCGLVSQAILSGYGGNVAAQNNIFKGVKELLKNNDITSDNNLVNNAGLSDATKNGGYKMINCSYQANKDSEVTTTAFPNSSSSSLKEEYFTWRTKDGKAPFAVKELSLDKVEENLNHELGVGTNNKMTDLWLYYNYR